MSTLAFAWRRRVHKAFIHTKRAGMLAAKKSLHVSESATPPVDFVTFSSALRSSKTHAFGRELARYSCGRIEVELASFRFL